MEKERCGLTIVIVKPGKEMMWTDDRPHCSRRRSPRIPFLSNDHKNYEVHDHNDDYYDFDDNDFVYEASIINV